MCLHSSLTKASMEFHLRCPWSGWCFHPLLSHLPWTLLNWSSYSCPWKVSGCQINCDELGKVMCKNITGASGWFLNSYVVCESPNWDNRFLMNRIFTLTFLLPFFFSLQFSQCTSKAHKWALALPYMLQVWGKGLWRPNPSIHLYTDCTQIPGWLLHVGDRNSRDWGFSNWEK